MPALVLKRLPEGAPADSAAGWLAIQELVRELRDVPDAADVRAITTLGTGERTVTYAVVPEPALGAFVSRDRRQALIHVVAGGGQRAADARLLVDRIRTRFVGDSTIAVGGFAAMSLDYHHAMRHALGPLALLAAAGTLLAMMVIFRAPLLAFKTVTLNLLVALAALGVVSIAAPIEGLPVTIPVAAFGIAFALSIDYELLLLFGVLREGRDGPDAIARGVAHASPLMLRGGVLLGAVLTGFLVSGFQPLMLLGAVLAVAILIDVVVVRPLVAPALLVLLGRWNWWPGHRHPEGLRSRRRVAQGRNHR